MQDEFLEIVKAPILGFGLFGHAFLADDEAVDSYP